MNVGRHGEQSNKELGVLVNRGADRQARITTLGPAQLGGVSPAFDLDGLLGSLTHADSLIHLREEWA